jgi:[ribosomal protein S5]-alanine N-acetyltransferase
MSARATATTIEIRRRGFGVYLRPPRHRDAGAFLAAVRASRRLHGRWVVPPTTPALFAAYVARYAGPAGRDAARATHAGFLACRVEDDAIVGAFNFSAITRGLLQSAYLGYYAMTPYAGRGYMREGLALALRAAFGRLRLHRVEVNVQPDNAASLRLVEGAGFAREGYSRRYVKIGGRWRDHVRYALLAEDWRARRAPR